MDNTCSGKGNNMDKISKEELEKARIEAQTREANAALEMVEVLSTYGGLPVTGGNGVDRMQFMQEIKE